MVFGIMVCTTLNMDHRKLRTGLFQEIRKKIIDKHVKGKGYKNTPLHLTMYLFRLPKRASHVVGGLIMAQAATTDSRHIGSVVEGCPQC